MRRRILLYTPTCEICAVVGYESYGSVLNQIKCDMYVDRLPAFDDNTWFRIFGYISMTDVLQWLCMMSRGLRDTVRQFHLDEAREYWDEMPEGAWRDAEVLSYVHSGRALFPWRRGFEGITRSLCTVDFFADGLMPCGSAVERWTQPAWGAGYRVEWGFTHCRPVNDFMFYYKGHKDLRWRPWPMVFQSPARLIANGWAFDFAGYRHAMHWHRQLLGLLGQAYVPQAQEAAAFPPFVRFVFNRIS